jgi:hypothetical protein
MLAEASLIEHNLNLPKPTTSLDGLSESLRNYLSQDAIYGIKFKLRTSIPMCSACSKKVVSICSGLPTHLSWPS